MSSSSDPHSNVPWLRGALISGVGVIIGAIAFAVFCYALGLNFTDQGWSDNQASPWETNRVALIGSLLGLSFAILAFWLGFIQITRR